MRRAERMHMRTVMTVQRSTEHLFEVLCLCWGRGGGGRTRPLGRVRKGLGFPGRLVVWMLWLVKTLFVETLTC